MDSSRAFWEQRYRYLAATPGPPSAPARQAQQWLAARIRESGRRPTVLDLGAGGSNDAACLATSGAAVVAVDFVASSLAHLPPHVSRVVADLRHPLPFGADVADCVYSHLLMSCAFREGETALLVREVYRVLVSGGTFWVVARSTEDPTCRRLPQRGPGYYDLSGVGLHFFSAKSMRRWLAAFTIEKFSAIEFQQHGEEYNAIVVVARKGE